MKTILGAILVLVAVAMAMTSAAELKIEGRRIEGVVLDQSTRSPVEFARVQVTRLTGGGPVWSALTDEDGGFEVQALALAGTWRVAVEADGYHEVREGLVLGSTPDPVNLVIRLWSADRERPGEPMIEVRGAGSGVRVLSAARLRSIEAERTALEKLEEAEPGRYAPAEPRDQPGVPGRIQGERDEAKGIAAVRGDDASLAAPGSQATAEGNARVFGQVMRRQAPGTSADAGALSDETLARLAQNSDELWILERTGPRPAPADPDQDPGTGCLVVIDDEQKEIPVPLEHTDVHARIEGYVASVDVRQRFHNPFTQTIEAEYVFPLPHDAAVNDFLMVVGERRIRGIIREKEEAREIYERARQAGYVASLLEQERPNIFRQRVANIEPGHAIEVELHYFNALPYRDGEFEFAFPLVVGPRFNPPGSADPVDAVPRGAVSTHTAVSYLAPDERSGHDVDITVELDAGLKIEQVQSLNHAARVQRDGASRALIDLAAYDRIPNRDFVLRYRVASDAIKSGVLVHREGEEGYFAMMLVPPASLEHLERAPVEFVFVLDCSGSMNGWPMEQSKSAMRRALRQLRPGDSFQIIRFSESASALGAQPVEATAANVERGLDYVDRLQGSGGTMMIEGIKAALDFPHDPERTRIVSFMTDGYIGNEDEIFAAVASRLGDTRIFSFGVGNSVNRHLIEGMARMGRGAVAYIGLDDDLDAVDEFYRIVRHPALSDVTIDWGRMGAKQVFPQRIDDLFVGRPVLLHGRFEGSGQTTVTVRGRAGGQRVTMKVAVDLDAQRRRESLPLLWARSEIQHIADRLAREQDDSLQSRGLDLALNYNLVSDWTSFVAVDASSTVEEPGTRTETVPVPVPEGVKYDTTVRGRGR